MSLFVYKRTEDELWTVGTYLPDGTWHPESDHGSVTEAQNQVHWLNGGCQPGRCAPSARQRLEAYRYVREHLGPLVREMLAEPRMTLAEVSRVSGLSPRWVAELRDQPAVPTESAETT